MAKERGLFSVFTNNGSCPTGVNGTTEGELQDSVFRNVSLNSAFHHLAIKRQNHGLGLGWKGP